MERMLAEASAETWAAPTRCDGWSVRDVVAHLVTVNRFWEASVRGGRDGRPTRMLAAFDPAADPGLFVESMSALHADDVFEQFVASNDGFLGAVAELSDEEWTRVAESPIGHVGLDRTIDHALWDAWVHERDIALPLGLPLVDEPDELAACLRYAAAAGPAINAGQPGAFTGLVQVSASDPETEFVVEVTTAVAVHEGAGGADVPCLRGGAAELIDALSVRTPLPANAPDEWHLVMQGVVRAFATE